MRKFIPYSARIGISSKYCSVVQFQPFVPRIAKPGDCPDESRSGIPPPSLGRATEYSLKLSILGSVHPATPTAHRDTMNHGGEPATPVSSRLRMVTVFV